ncbi:MAG: ATP cone domain-containing protein [Promethearchaeota archaeon]|jgi:plastocyanin
MENVKKRSGETEKFDKTKLERSLRKTRVDKQKAIDITNRISEKEMNTTSEIRNMVVEELRKTDTEAAIRYESTRRLAAKAAIDAAKGVARLTEETMNKLNLEVGDTINLCHEDHKHTVKAERAAVGAKEIQLHEEDLKSLGVTDGTSIAVRRIK